MKYIFVYFIKLASFNVNFCSVTEGLTSLHQTTPRHPSNKLHNDSVFGDRFTNTGPVLTIVVKQTRQNVFTPRQLMES